MHKVHYPVPNCRATNKPKLIILSDVADKESLEALHDEICQTMPQIAGVAQGASKSMFLDSKCDFANTMCYSSQWCWTI